MECLHTWNRIHQHIWTSHRNPHVAQPRRSWSCAGFRIPVLDDLSSRAGRKAHHDVPGFLYGTCWFLFRRRNAKKAKLIAEGATPNGLEGDQSLETMYIL
ncbi:hypothetical protein EK21DRAFT_71454 [Setomelanomma holmii]|uniref:Uncharacterized protein n=1 Tax=Setomelanomma holmii TaxID=210430 RepID=A0A9P4LL54_9PLEO|nr:hypothetical protein EK21DRAFT_71454 [Setomelanomma holmii]